MIRRSALGLVLFGVVFLAVPAEAQTCRSEPCTQPGQVVVNRAPAPRVEQSALNRSSPGSIAPFLAVPVGVVIMGSTLGAISVRRRRLLVGSTSTDVAEDLLSLDQRALARATGR